jgi:hypothetical protein
MAKTESSMVAGKVSATSEPAWRRNWIDEPKSP